MALLNKSHLIMACKMYWDDDEWTRRSILGSVLTWDWPGTDLGLNWVWPGTDLELTQESKIKFESSKHFSSDGPMNEQMDGWRLALIELLTEPKIIEYNPYKDWCVWVSQMLLLVTKSQLSQSSKVLSLTWMGLTL